MIALLLALALLDAAPEEGESPFHISIFAGSNAEVQRRARTWLEMDAQLEFGSFAFLRGALSQPVTESGKNASKLTQRMRTLCAGTEWRHDWWWLAAGAGWTWRRLDTNATYLDRRDVFVEDQDGLHPANHSQVEWNWPQRVEDDAPYFMGEFGIGWEHASVCIRSEYRFRPAVGTYLRFRIP